MYLGNPLREEPPGFSEGRQGRPGWATGRSGLPLIGNRMALFGQNPSPIKQICWAEARWQDRRSHPGEEEWCVGQGVEEVGEDERRKVQISYRQGWLPRPWVSLGYMAGELESTGGQSMFAWIHSC